MKKLEKEQLEEIWGGSVSSILVAGLIALGAILAGIIDGITRPLACNE